MKSFAKMGLGILAMACFCVFLFQVPATAAMPGFDATKMSDMSNFDPTNPVIPTGDTVKIAIIDAFSGPAAGNGEIYWIIANWVAYDLNQKGGILVDGKKKKIQMIKADTKSQPAVTKKEVERMCLEEKVNAMFGVSGSHLSLVIQQIADQYKTIYMNGHAPSDDLHNGKNFNRYTFRTCMNTSMFGEAMAYFYGKRPEKKFYILCQDYLFGHAMADAFKAGLKKHKPDAQIVGEAFHPLFMKDFAPYITKIQGSGAEVIYTGDWLPDSDNLLMQMKNLGFKLPVANLYADNAETYKALGGQFGKGMVNANDYMVTIDTPENKAFVKAWTEAWKKWKKPYNALTYQYPASIFGDCVNQFYWMLNVMERAGTTNAEKVIKVWEGDEYKSLTGPVKMRACDHQVVRDMYVTEFEFPNPYVPDRAFYGKPFIVPAQACAPPLPGDLDRCKTK
jgi:branched-chain amino acid transport system substrate-binding protein